MVFGKTLLLSGNDVQLQKYVDTFNSYSNVSAKKGGYAELDSKLGIQDIHTTIYNGVEISYHYSGDGMLYYDAPWDDKIIEPIIVKTTEKEYSKAKNTESISIEMIYAIGITASTMAVRKLLSGSVSFDY